MLPLMTPPLTTVSLPQVYCGWCHLATRKDRPRCLHCNKLLEAPPVAPTRTARRAKPTSIRGAVRRTSRPFRKSA